jgi:UDP-N-acetyl-2-amino-2-deoxyglucuronate dehydrogenase
MPALMQRPDIDAIVVTTPHHLHAEESIRALETGKHVLVEKPMATSVVDCDRMIAAAARNRRVLATGYQQRFRSNNVRAKELIDGGFLGRVLTVQVSMPCYVGGFKDGGFGGGNWAWWDYPESIARTLNSAPHALDQIRGFTGAKVRAVSALSRTFLPGQTNEDTTLALVEYGNGTLASLFFSDALPAPEFPGETFRFRIMGSAGLIDLDPYGELRVADEKGWRVDMKQPPIGYESADSAFGEVRMRAYCNQLRSLMDAIEGKPAALGTSADGRADVETCLAMFASSRERRWIDLP